MKLLEILKKEMETPTPFGWFHLMMFILVIITTVLFCVFFKDAKDKTFRKIIFITWIIFLVFELYKELTYVLEYEFDETGKLLDVRYLWYAFPYQFCSTPFYILPLIAFLPNGKVRDALMAYTTSFILFAGVAVMIIPGDVFVRQIGINIQTMVHHGLQVVLGVYVAVYNRKRYQGKFKDILNWYWPGLVVFACMASIAIILNEVMFASGILNGQTFNMFFISRHFSVTLPILSSFANDIPYMAYLLIYLFGFALVAAIMITLEWVFIVPFQKLLNKLPTRKKCVII